MKKFAMVLLVAILVSVLFGCTNGSNFNLSKEEIYENVSWRIDPSWSVEETQYDRIYINGGKASDIYMEFDFSESSNRKTTDEYIDYIKSMYEDIQQYIKNWKSEYLGDVKGSNFTGEVYKYSFEYVKDNEVSETYLAFIKSGSTRFIFTASREPLFKEVLNTIKID